MKNSSLKSFIVLIPGKIIFQEVTANNLSFRNPDESVITNVLYLITEFQISWKLVFCSFLIKNDL